MNVTCSIVGNGQWITLRNTTGAATRCQGQRCGERNWGVNMCFCPWSGFSGKTCFETFLLFFGGGVSVVSFLFFSQEYSLSPVPPLSSDDLWTTVFWQHGGKCGRGEGPWAWGQLRLGSNIASAVLPAVWPWITLVWVSLSFFFFYIQVIYFTFVIIGHAYEERDQGAWHTLGV